MSGDDIQVPVKKHRSVSQVNQYERCPYSYYLARVKKVWQRPAAWLPQGSAVHEAAEAWEKSGRTMTLDEAKEVFREAYSRHCNEYCKTTPNFDWWFASGQHTADNIHNPEKGDIFRRFGIGLGQVEKYVRWYTDHPEEVIWIAPDGTPGIELGFDIELDGVPIRGFIDAVITKPRGKPEHCGPIDTIVRDNKTGNNPGDDFQLAVYGIALAEQFGIEPPTLGDYWMGRPGKPTHPYDLTEWPRERVSAKFAELEENIRAERFDPKPDPKKCGFCDVALSCDYRAV